MTNVTGTVNPLVKTLIGGMLIAVAVISLEHWQPWRTPCKERTCTEEERDLWVAYSLAEQDRRNSLAILDSNPTDKGRFNCYCNTVKALAISNKLCLYLNQRLLKYEQKYGELK
jgi:hypothetical protein